ncbi:MAG TPA: 4Fe-4S dicluster domain-containing protein [Sulfuricurvum sp.]|nr:4Fe-4S dicluster domain-containing protein [Sulfuricurvum sp.]
MKFLRDYKTFLALLIPFLAIPWIMLGDFHLLLFNFSHDRLEIGGFAIEMSTFAMISLLLLLGVALTLISALSLSRFYCGTLCPNTFFAHLLNLFKGKKTSFFSKAAGFILLAFLASMLAFSLVAYGISTDELIDAIAHLTFAGWLVIILSLLMIAEIYMVQGWYCAYLCPYGAITAILPIEDRLTYRFDDPNINCTECEGCVKICPIPDLDIRHGFDIRCIQCGLCEEACEKVFAKCTRPSLIHPEKRSILRAGGRRSMGVFVAIIVIMLLTTAGIVTLLDEKRLESCRLENRALY